MRELFYLNYTRWTSVNGIFLNCERRRKNCVHNILCCSFLVSITSSISSISKVHYLITHTIPYHTTPVPRLFHMHLPYRRRRIELNEVTAFGKKKNCQILFPREVASIAMVKKESGDDHTMPHFISFTMNVSKHWVLDLYNPDILCIFEPIRTEKNSRRKF